MHSKFGDNALCRIPDTETIRIDPERLMSEGNEASVFSTRPQEMRWFRRVAGRAAAFSFSARIAADSRRRLDDPVRRPV